MVFSAKDFVFLFKNSEKKISLYKHFLKALTKMRCLIIRYFCLLQILPLHTIYNNCFVNLHFLIFVMLMCSVLGQLLNCKLSIITHNFPCFYQRVIGIPRNGIERAHKQWGWGCRYLLEMLNLISQIPSGNGIFLRGEGGGRDRSQGRDSFIKGGGGTKLKNETEKELQFVFFIFRILPDIYEQISFLFICEKSLTIRKCFFMDGLHSPIYASDRVRRYRLVHLVSLTLQLQKNELMNFEDSFFYFKTIEKC